MKAQIVRPKTKIDFQSYYEFRWRMLRKPLGKPRGSEKDDLEKDSCHVMLIKEGIVIGVGRIHFIIKNSFKKAQIRYMAIDEKFQKKGYGSKLLLTLEEISIKNKIHDVFLHAREESIDFKGILL